MAINRFYQPTQANYVSQYADYKLPYEAIQNAVIGRQQKFDQNEAMLANAANKYGQIASRAVDSEGKSAAIDQYLDNVHKKVNEKYGGDFSLGASDIYNETAKFTASPMWDNMRTALEDENRYKASKQAAMDAGHEFWERPGSTGNQSIFNADGSYNAPSYDNVTIDSAKDRQYRESLFNNKELDKNSGLDIAKFNEQALKGEDPFLAYIETEYRNFDDSYIKSALDEYWNSGMPKIKKYLDEAGGDEDIAKARALEDIISVSKEYKANRKSAKVMANPVHTASLAGKDKEEGPVGDRTAKAETDNFLTTPNGKKAVTSIAELNDILRNPETDSDTQFKAGLVDDAVKERLETDEQFAVYRQRQAEVDRLYETEIPVVTMARSKQHVAGLFGEQENSHNEEIFDALLNATLNPENQTGLSMFSELGERLKGVIDVSASFISAITPIFGNDKMLTDGLKRAEGNRKTAKEKDRAFSLGYKGDTTSVSENAEYISKYLIRNPEEARKLGFVFDEMGSLNAAIRPSNPENPKPEIFKAEKEISVAVGERNKEYQEATKEILPDYTTRNYERKTFQDPDGKWTSKLDNTFKKTASSYVTDWSYNRAGVDTKDIRLMNVIARNVDKPLGALFKEGRVTLETRDNKAFAYVTVTHPDDASKNYDIPMDLSIANVSDKESKQIINDMQTDMNEMAKAPKFKLEESEHAYNVKLEEVNPIIDGLDNLSARAHENGSIYLKSNGKNVTYKDLYEAYIRMDMLPKFVEQKMLENRGDEKVQLSDSNRQVMPAAQFLLQ